MIICCKIQWFPSIKLGHVCFKLIFIISFSFKNAEVNHLSAEWVFFLYPLAYPLVLISQTEDKPHSSWRRYELDFKSFFFYWFFSSPIDLIYFSSSAFKLNISAKGMVFDKFAIWSPFSSVIHQSIFFDPWLCRFWPDKSWKVLFEVQKAIHRVKFYEVRPVILFR